MVILFKPYHVPLILDGSKVQTRRRWKTNHVKEGGIYQARTTLFGKPFALLYIWHVRKQRLGDITPEETQKEGGYTVGEYMKKWMEINGSWDPNETVVEVTFAVAQVCKEGE